VDYWSHNLKLRPLIAPKKKWVEPERTEEGDNVSSEDESCSTQRSAATERSEKRQEAGDDCPPVVEGRANPRRYGARSIRMRVPTDHEAGMRNTSAAGDDNTQMTGGDGVGARVVSARSWLEGGEEGQGGDLDIGGDLEDLDDQLFYIIQTVPTPCTIARALRLAVIALSRSSTMVSQDEDIDNHTYDEKDGTTHTHKKYSKCAGCESSDGRDSAFGHGCRSAMYWILQLAENRTAPHKRFIRNIDKCLVSAI